MSFIEYEASERIATMLLDGLKAELNKNGNRGKVNTDA
jgi:hypothetical protein